MKTLLFSLSVLLPAPLFASASEVTCVRNSAADYQLNLFLDNAGTLSQLNLDFTDWGTAGVGDTQDVTTDANGTYRVTTEPKSPIGIEPNTKVTLGYQSGKIVSVELRSDIQGPSTDDYHCP